MRPLVSGVRRAVTVAAVVALVAGCAGQAGSGAAHRARGARRGAAHGTPGRAARRSAGVRSAAVRRSAAQAPARFADVALAIPSGNAGGGLTAGLHVRLPRGWRAEVWARVPGARLEAWTPQGDLLVSQPSTGEVMELVPRRDRSASPAQHVLVSGLSTPQGLAFAKLDGHEVLYVAEDDAIDQFAWNDGRVGAQRVIVSGLPDTAPAGSDNHMLKNVVVGPGGRLYVDIGSGSNASPPTQTDPPRAAVVSYSADGTGMQVVATGVRNGDGLSFAPDGTLWTAVNERDQISYPFHHAYRGVSDAYGQVIPAYVDNHPPDEVARLTPGRNLGWPYCDPDPDVSPGATGTSLRYAELPFTDDQQTNPGGTMLDCAKLTPLDRGLPAHSAPLGFHFLEGTDLPARWTQGAILAVHGSWDREPPRAPAVLWLPWNGKTETLGAPITLVGGFQDADGTRWGRPADAVAGPDGAVYVSDDQAGAIYRIVP
jgi:glucose/arabinose dehydrogenase